MRKSSRKSRYTFVISMLASSVLLLGLVHVFEISSPQISAVLLPMLVIVLALMILAFVIASIITWWRSRRV